MAGPAYTMEHLISEYGKHVGAGNQCSLCHKFTMYAIRYPDRDTLFVCSYCDTGKRGI